MFLPAYRAADPVRTYYTFNGAWAYFSALTFTLSLVYQIKEVGLSPLQLVLVGTTLEVACFLFEIPTGIVADLYSRRLSVIIGFTFIGAGFLLQGLVPTFLAILAAQVLWGLGFTFTSGADQAWITDEVGEEKVAPVFVRTQQAEPRLPDRRHRLRGRARPGEPQPADAAVRCRDDADGVGAVRLHAGAELPPDAEGRAGDLPADGRHLQTRPGGRPASSGGPHAGADQPHRRAGQRGFRPALVGPDPVGLQLPDLLGTTDPALWFAAFSLVGTLLALAASLVVNKVSPERVNSLHPNGLLALLSLFQLGGVLGFTLAGHFWLALAAMWLGGMAATIAYPIESAWLNRNLESKSRATVISMVSQANAIGQVAGGPPLGAVAGATSVRTALTLSGLILSPIPLLYLRLRPDPHSAVPAADAEAEAKG